MAENTLKARLLHAYKSESEWNSSNPILKQGEIGYVADATNRGRHKVGDGSTKWNDLPWGDKKIWDEVNGIQIGGRNLIPNSKNANLKIKETTINVVIDDDSCTITPKSINTLSWGSVYSNISLEKNQTYTFSAEISDINIESSNGYAVISVAKNPPNSGWSDYGIIRVTKIGRYYITFNTGDNTNVKICIGLLLASLNDYVVFKNLKLEKGNKATDWTPAPEDKADVSHTHSASDISSGTLSSSILPIIQVSKGGTGLSSITSGQVLIGNGTGNITTRAIDTTNGGTSGSTSLITSGAVYAGLAGKANNHSHPYLPLSGGTMNGALNFANGTWNTVGDDVAIGDINIAGTLGIIGKNGNTSIRLVPYGASTTIGTDTPGVVWTCNDNASSTISGILYGTFSGNLSGNASTASKWQTARTLTLSGAVTGSVSIDGSADVTLSTSVNHDHSRIAQSMASGTLPGKAPDGYVTFHYNVNHGVSGNMPTVNNANSIINISRHGGDYSSQLGFSSDGNMYYRAGVGTTAWKTILDTGNYTGILDGCYVNVTGDTMTGNLTAPSVYTSNWFRSTGSTGWYSETYNGGWYMTDSNFIRNYNSKALSININSNNAWGIGGHRLATVFKGNDHVSILLSTNTLGYGLCVNNDGNWYWGKRTTNSETSASGDTYLLQGNTTLIRPFTDMAIGLGQNRASEFSDAYIRAIKTRHLDASGVYNSDMHLYIGYGSGTPTEKTFFYYSTGTHGASATSRTQFAEINSNGLYALTRFGVNGQNTSYHFYVNGTSYHSNTINFAENTTAINFRPGLNSYYTTISYQTTGNEALVFAAKNTVTSFMFVTGEDSVANHSSNRWTELSPTLQIKNKSVYVNSLIANDTNPSYNFYVNGTSYFNGVTTINSTLTANGLIYQTSNDNTLTLGAQNNAYCHIMSSALNFYFNKTIEVNGNILPYTNNSFDLGSTGKYWRNIYGTTFHGALNGNAASATKLAYGPILSSDAAIDSFHAANTFQTALWNNTSSPGVSNGIILDMGWVNTSYGAQFAIDDDPGYFIALRQRDGNGWKAWKRIPMGDGTGASGTWGINITGNSATTTTAYNLASVHGNECIVGADGAGALWLNYRNHYGGDTTSGTQLTEYYFGDRKGNYTTTTLFTGHLRSAGASIFGAIEIPSYTVDIRGSARSTGRIYANEWIQFDNYTGLYSPNNNAHFYPNNTTSYGQWQLRGQRGSYSGIHFGDSTGYMTIMDSLTHKGLYEQDWDWILYFNRDSKKLGLRTSDLSSYAVTCEGDFYCRNGWLRTAGSYGWYNESYGGGWYMEDSSWIRTYGSKNIYQNTGILRTDGTLQVGDGGKYLNANSSGISVGVQIQKAGVSSSWIGGRTSAMIRMNSISGYSPFASIKTTNGSWEIGSYDSSSYTDDLVFSYCTDANFNAGTNSTTAQIRLKSNGYISASGFYGNLSYSYITDKPDMLNCLRMYGGTALDSKGTTSDSNAQYKAIAISTATAGTSGFSKALTDLPKGKYSVMIRMKITANSSSGNIIKVQAGDTNALKTFYVRPNMFTATGTYQTFGFTVDHNTTSFTANLSIGTALSGVTLTIDYLAIAPAFTAISSVA